MERSIKIGTIPSNRERRAAEGVGTRLGERVRTLAETASAQSVLPNPFHRN